MQATDDAQNLRFLATHVGDPDGILSSWLCSGSPWAAAGVWKIIPHMEAPLPPRFCLSNK